jgi:PAS domain S-box-containing protein
MGPSDAILGSTFDAFLRRAPAVILVAEAPSGRILLRTEHLPELDASALPLSRTLATGEAIVYEEISFLAPDGATRCARVSCTPVHDAKQNLVAVVAIGEDVTESKQRDWRLGYLNQLLESSDDAIVATDADMRVTVWNAGAEALFGWSAEEAIGRDGREVVVWAIPPERFDEEFGRLLEADRTAAELVAVRRDGSHVTVSVTAVALRDADGELTGLLGVHRDVTELHDARRRTESILESITDDFAAVDGGWCFNYLNDRALERARQELGDPDLGCEDLIGRNCWELFPSLVGSGCWKALHRAADERRTVVFETVLPRSGGAFEVRAYPFAGGLSIFMSDIAPLKRAQQDSADRARQQAVIARLGLHALGRPSLQELLDEVAAVVGRTLDVEFTKVVELLPAGEDLLLRAGVGWRKGVIGSKTEPSGRGSQAGAALLTGGPIVSGDVRDDPRFTPSEIALEHGVVSAASVVIGGPRDPFGALSAMTNRRREFSDQDVNFLQAAANLLASAVERAAADRSLHEAREADRQRIARDLQEEALRDLTRALEEANRTAGDRPDSSADDLVSALERAGRRLRSAIYDLRLSSGEHRPLRERLEELVAMQSGLADGIEVVLDLRDGTPSAPLGPRGTELVRIVGEAVTNARHHGAPSTIRVGVWGTTEKVWVEVSDDGIGFDASKRSPSGTGISGMYERAALLNGTLSIVARPGAGTRVRLELPQPGISTAQEPARVLLVDDHVTVRDAIAEGFDREPDFKVVGQAGSLAEAHRMLTEVDVAIIDLALPDGYGGDLIRALREVNPQAQAIVLSTSPDRAEIARAVERGAAGVLDKTVRLKEILDTVRQLRAGKTLLPLDEVVELLRFAGEQRDREHDDRQAIARLTPREREVLQLLAEGLDSQAVADRLFITVRTHRNHVASILAKLGVHSQLQALVFALRLGVVEIR